MTEILSIIIETLLIPAIILGIRYLTAYLQNKTKSDIVSKYLGLISSTITSCVESVNQTYVDHLKFDGAFTKEKQEEALQKALEAAKTILSDDIKKYIISVSGDLDSYLTILIEAEIKQNKRA